MGRGFFPKKGMPSATGWAAPGCWNDGGCPWATRCGPWQADVPTDVGHALLAGVLEARQVQDDVAPLVRLLSLERGNNARQGRDGSLNAPAVGCLGIGPRGLEERKLARWLLLWCIRAGWF